MDNPYVRLTEEFNTGRARALLSSGQAVVLYRLAIMSKDGDWIIREDDETVDHVLDVLESHDARYRFGSPLDLRWLANGWSCHFEYRERGLRLRCDFVTRPPRIPPDVLQAEWEHPQQREVPVVTLPVLADLKKTNREKDYAVIGELARLMDDPRLAFLYSRSARDLIRMADEHPEALRETVAERPVLARIDLGRDELERSLDEERRSLIRANEERLERYAKASLTWRSIWSEVSREMAGHGLRRAHEIMVSRAENALPYEP
jgi:hypothetical protein